MKERKEGKVSGTEKSVWERRKKCFDQIILIGPPDPPEIQIDRNDRIKWFDDMYPFGFPKRKVQCPPARTSIDMFETTATRRN